MTKQAGVQNGGGDHNAGTRANAERLPSEIARKAARVEVDTEDRLGRRERRRDRRLWQES